MHEKTEFNLPYCIEVILSRLFRLKSDKFSIVDQLSYKIFPSVLVVN